MSTTTDALREEVRQHYAAASDCCESLGYGNPTAVADLREGETVLDLGSGGGLDVIASAKRVGPTGCAFGLDMTDEMLARARANATRAGVDNVVFLRGVVEDVPLPSDAVDVVISNCVVNLSTDKGAVLAEIARVLKPGGRVAIADIVAEDRLSPGERVERGSYVGCIAGALSESEYEAAGLEHVSVVLAHEVADGMHSAIVKAVKPQAETSAVARDRLATFASDRERSEPCRRRGSRPWRRPCSSRRSPQAAAARAAARRRPRRHRPRRRPGAPRTST